MTEEAAQHLTHSNPGYGLGCRIKLCGPLDVGEEVVGTDGLELSNLKALEQCPMGTAVILPQSMGQSLEISEPQFPPLEFKGGPPVGGE